MLLLWIKRRLLFKKVILEILTKKTNKVVLAKQTNKPQKTKKQKSYSKLGV